MARPKTTHFCKVCGSPFVLPTNGNHRREYCSPGCRHLARRGFHLGCAPEEKRCRICGEVKPLTFFDLFGGRGTGDARRGTCKACRNPGLVSQRVLRKRATVTEQPLTPGDWKTIKLQFRHRCAYCGRSDLKLTQDHVVPVSKGGLHTLTNVVPACGSCNSRKNAGLPLVPIQAVLI